MIPISTPPSPPSSAKTIVRSIGAGPVAVLADCEQMRLYTPDCAARGTDIANVAIGHSVGVCFCVGGVLAFCGYRNDIWRRASDLNIRAKLIERHSWTDVRQCAQRAPDNYPQQPSCVAVKGSVLPVVGCCCELAGGRQRDQRGTREHRRLVRRRKQRHRGCPGPPQHPQEPCAAAQSAWTSAGPVPAGSSGLRLRSPAYPTGRRMWSMIWLAGKRRIYPTCRLQGTPAE